MTIMQGDSYPIYVELAQDGVPLTPEMVEELEVCVGDQLRKLYSKGEVLFEANTNQWSFNPQQSETLDLSVGSYAVDIRIKYKDSGSGEVFGFRIGKIHVTDSNSEEVI